MLLFCGQARAEGAPTIELYTMGMGDVIWEKFGHAAICVIDEDPRKDRCYNYGTTNFAAPVALGWGVLRGTAKFWVSVTTPERMLDFYIGFDRTVYRQVLSLTDEQARAAAGKLASDALPANKHYVYHHVEDNCSTRVRDVINSATDGALERGSKDSLGVSYRDYTRQGVAGTPVLLALSELGLGRRADAVPDVYGAMFLPRILRDRVKQIFKAEPEVVYERRGEEFREDPGKSRIWFFLLAFLIGIPALASELFGCCRRAGMAASLVPVLALASVLWAIAIISPLPELRYNELLLVFLPTDLLLFSARSRNYARARVIMLLLISALTAIGVFSQAGALIFMPAALIPCVVAARLLPTRRL